MSSQFINGYTNGADFQGYCATIALLLHIYSKIEAARDQRLKGLTGPCAIPLLRKI